MKKSKVKLSPVARKVFRTVQAIGYGGGHLPGIMWRLPQYSESQIKEACEEINKAGLDPFKDDI